MSLGATHEGIELTALGCRDTITTPTEAMLRCSLHASLGDDVYGEDQATSDFEERVAKLAGKEAAMFAVSGTMVSSCLGDQAARLGDGQLL